MEDGPNEGFAFIIDTDKYAGNFEREMTAYLTGHIGDCQVGEEMEYPDVDTKFFNNITSVDQEGCYRPTTCCPLANSQDHNGVAIFFSSKPTDEQIKFMKKRVKGFDAAFKSQGRMSQFHKDNPVINVTGFRLIEFTKTETEIKI